MQTLPVMPAKAGIHAEELGARNNPDTSVLSDIFAAAGVVPKAVMRQLNW